VITSCLFKAEETASIDADIEELENYRQQQMQKELEEQAKRDN